MLAPTHDIKLLVITHLLLQIHLKLRTDHLWSWACARAIQTAAQRSILQHKSTHTYLSSWLLMLVLRSWASWHMDCGCVKPSFYINNLAPADGVLQAMQGQVANVHKCVSPTGSWCETRPSDIPPGCNTYPYFRLHSNRDLVMPSNRKLVIP